MCPKKPIIKLLTVEQPSIVIDLLINKICWCKNPPAPEKLELRKPRSPPGPAREV